MQKQMSLNPIVAAQTEPTPTPSGYGELLTHLTQPAAPGSKPRATRNLETSKEVKEPFYLTPSGVFKPSSWQF